ncbi:MAG TPA: amidohydrolase [Spirochaetota bacterium]|nr:amidohydrolase [Spirochaetota bacterium]
MQNLKVSIVQSDLLWHDIKGNLSRFENLLAPLEGRTHCIILPEMFTTGFTMDPAGLAEGMEGAAVSTMKKWSRSLDADIAGSIIYGDDGRYYNRLVWVKPDGGIFTYDKRHLFRMAGEEKVYTAGERLLTVELKGWKLRPFICYDLRFPVWTRNIGLEYDAAVYVANWPAKRSNHWKSLLTARAIENQCYVLAANRIGTDGNGNYYSGDSSAIDYSGKILFTSADEPCVHTVELSHAEMAEYRASFPAWKDADDFSVK